MTLIESIRTLIVVAAIALALLPAIATAEEDSKGLAVPYVEYSVGASFVQNQTLRGDDASGSGLWGRTEQKAGYTFGAAIGASILENFRAELGIDYRSSEVENIAVQSEPDDSDGDVALLSIMANGYFDLDLGVGVIPYVGAGIGWGRIKLDAQNEPGALQLDLDDTDSVFVYNVMVGGTYPISEVTDVSLGYRYVATEEVTLGAKVGATARRLEYEYDAHEIKLGLRFNF